MNLFSFDYLVPQQIYITGHISFCNRKELSNICIKPFIESIVSLRLQGRSVRLPQIRLETFFGEAQRRYYSEIQSLGVFTWTFFNLFGLRLPLSDKRSPDGTVFLQTVFVKDIWASKGVCN